MDDTTPRTNPQLVEESTGAPSIAPRTQALKDHQACLQSLSGERHIHSSKDCCPFETSTSCFEGHLCCGKRIQRLLQGRERGGRLTERLLGQTTNAAPQRDHKDIVG